MVKSLASGAVIVIAAQLSAVEFRSTTFTDRWQDLSASVRESASGDSAIRLDLSATEQSVLGFGTAVSELSGSSLAALDPKDRAAILDELFSAAGGNFTLIRTPIGASDFARDFYSYDEHPGDFAMEKFSIERDREVLLPLIKDILARNDGSFRVWGSPWCPPRWMKKSGAYASKPQTDPTWPTNDCSPAQQVHEGEDGFICDDAHFKAYATYFRKYIEAYRAEGVPLWMVMPQNEFNSYQVFPSCTWKAASLATFVGKYLGPALEGSGTELYFGTMERPSFDMARTILDDPDCQKYVRGAGFQWAGKDAIGPVHRCYPHLFLMQTEQECGDGRNDWKHARHSWELMRHYFEQGASAYEYWNLSLEDNALSRWGWRQNSLVSVVSAQRSFTYNVEYFVLKQVSHYVKRGAKRLRTEAGDHLAFVNPDGSVVVVFGNQGGPRTVSVSLRNRTWTVSLPADSVSSLFIPAGRSSRYESPKGEIVELWPKGLMPVVSTNQTYAPYMEFFKPAKVTTDAFLIVAPGGGYGGVAYDGEGYPVQKFCMEKGLNMAILKYRTPRPIGKPMYLSAWQDVQRAIRVARSQAVQRGYSPDKIGVMGFSAGGHLTILAATSSLTPAYEPVDDLDKLSCSPNWAVPVYPAYVLEHDKADRLQSEFKFDAATPRMCLLHGDADVFPALNSDSVYRKLRTMKVPAELHVFAYGDHVFFRNAHAEDTAAMWLDIFWNWLYTAGIRTPHPSANEKGAKRVIFGPIEKMGTYEKEAWRREPQDELVAYKDSPFWLADEYGAFEADFEYFLGDQVKPNWIRRTVRISDDRVWVAENDIVVYDGPHEAQADIWPFLRKPGKGLAEPGPLGIAPGRNGQRITMRILRTRK